MSPGSVTERVHFFVGEYQPEDRVAEGGGLAEEGEDIEVLELPFAEALAMVDDGRIMDGKTIILLQYLKTLMPVTPLMILIAGAQDAVQSCATRLLQAGHLPVTASWPTQAGEEDSRMDTERYGQLLLSRCDALLRVAGSSSLADRLMASAEEKGLVVYHEVDEIIGQAFS